MTRVVVSAKPVGETRIDQIDFSSDMPAGVTLSSAAGTISVYTGVDASPNLVLVSTTPVSVGNSPLVNVKTTAGVSGVIYALVITAVLSNTATAERTLYLAVIPDLP